MHLSNQQAAILCLKNNCRVECHLISTRHLSLGFQHGPALFCSFPSFLFYFLPFPTLFYSTFYSCLLFSTLFLQYNTLFLHYYTVHSFHLSTSHLSLSLQHRSALLCLSNLLQTVFLSLSWSSDLKKQFYKTENFLNCISV